MQNERGTYGCVPHVDDVLEQLRGQVVEVGEVVLHLLRIRQLHPSHLEPRSLDHTQALVLKRSEEGYTML